MCINQSEIDTKVTSKSRPRPYPRSFRCRVFRQRLPVPVLTCNFSGLHYNVFLRTLVMSTGDIQHENLSTVWAPHCVDLPCSTYVETSHVCKHASMKKWQAALKVRCSRSREDRMRAWFMSLYRRRRTCSWWLGVKDQKSKLQHQTYTSKSTDIHTPVPTQSNIPAITNRPSIIALE